MAGHIYRNASFATVDCFRDLIDHGVAVNVRGQNIRELRNRLTVLSHPQERCLFVPHRGNNVIATLAETLWVMAGRADVDWLSTFLPRAIDFSDDGLSWRGGYGPRLRHWNGVDQVAQVRRLLLEEQTTRRAVMSIFDPDRDFVSSKDIPCNNWLHWLVRDGRLNLTIAVRSNDLMWGFSGINSFEWSVLQEMLAHWIGAEVGDATYLASSLHLYEHHSERARRAVSSFCGISCYDFGLSSPTFQTSFENFDSTMSTWFALENQLRQEPNRPCQIEDYLDDPFLTNSLKLVRLHHGASAGWSSHRIAEELSLLPPTDLSAAAYEFFGRKHPEVLEAVPHESIALFLASYGTAQEFRSPMEFLRVVKELHALKNSAYGDSWKKRGEVTSILANVARKVDRLEQHQFSSKEYVDESVLDTAIDLFVYLLKYRLYLFDLAPVAAPPSLRGAPTPYSDNPANFDLLVDTYSTPAQPSQTARQIKSLIIVEFEALHGLALNGSAVLDRLEKVSELTMLALYLVLALATERPELVNRLMQSISIAR
jgi:thymidylate synthase